MRTLLSNFNLKQTKKREALLQVFDQASAPLLIEDVYEEANKLHEMNRSTAYRAINQFCECGLLNRVVSQDGHMYYHLKQRSHKHVLLCSSCKKRVPIDHCPVHALEAQLESSSGFIITSHNLEFVGICPACQKNNPR